MTTCFNTPVFKKALIFVSIFTILLPTSKAQTNGNDFLLEQTKYDHLGLLTFAKVKSKVLIKDAHDAKNALTNILNLKDNFSLHLVQSLTDNLNTTHFKYQLKYKDVEIENYIYQAHSKEGYLYVINGQFVQSLPINNIGNVSLTEAQSIAVQQFPDPQNVYGDLHNGPIRGELVIKKHNRNFYYAYKFKLYSNSPLSGKCVYMNTMDNTVITTEKLFMNNQACTSTTSHYSGNQEVCYESNSTNFCLVDNSRSITTYFGPNGPNQSEIVCHDNENWVLTGDSIYAIDGHFAGSYYIDWLDQRHNRSSIDDNGLGINIYVNEDFGGQPNAFWDQIDGAHFTPPIGNAGSTAAPHVVGHEISHGLVQYSSNLDYFGEQAALHESFADLFGSFSERFHFPGIAPELLWASGEEVIPPNGIRNMQEPGVTQNPDTYQGNFWDPQFFNYHSNGVVHSHAYYLLCEGGSGTNDNGDDFVVEAIGYDDAEDIAYRVLTTYIVPTSPYIQTRDYALQATEDLYGNCSFQYAQVENAFYAVGIGDSTSCSPTAPSASFTISNSQLCELDQVIFTSTSTGGGLSYNWNFGVDANPSTANTAGPHNVTYGSLGSKTVTLQVTNVSGTSQVSNNLSVIPEPIALFTNAINNLQVTFTNASSNATTYLWDFGDGTTSTVENPVHTYSSQNQYTVTLTAGNGACENIYTDRVLLNVGLENVEQSLNLNLFPNPAQNHVYVTINNIEKSKCQIEIINAVGNSVVHKDEILALNENNYIINTRSLANGVYLLKVKSGETISWRKLIVAN